VAAADYEAEVLSHSPWLLWMLDETSGTTADDASPNNRDGTYAGAYTQGVAGPVDASLAVQATNNDTVAMATVLTGNAVTLAAWVYPTAVNCAIVQSGQNASVSQGIGLYLDGSQRLTLAVLGGGVTAVSSPVNLPLDTWAYVVGTWDGTNARIYLNGSLWNSASGARTINYNGGSGTGAGSHPNTSLQLRGRIMGAAIYQAALSESVIGDHYDAMLASAGIPAGGAVINISDLVDAAGARASVGGADITDTATVDTAGARASTGGATLLDRATIVASGARPSNGGGAVLYIYDRIAAAGARVSTGGASVLDRVLVTAAGLIPVPAQTDGPTYAVDIDTTGEADITTTGAAVDDQTGSADAHRRRR
jgi:hypothetical protein